MNAPLRQALGVGLATICLLAFLELAIRGVYLARNSLVDVVVLPYTAAQDWGPVPPWIDGLRILEKDPGLLWRTRAGVQRSYLDVYSPVRHETDRAELLRSFIPTIPESLVDNPVWSVSTNSLGFREREFQRDKPSDAFRIACLGDSWTFGANVSQSDAYPQRLAAHFERAHPGASFDVLNLGVMGYSSRQGLELLRRRVLDFDADLTLIGFGMNDSIVSGWRDAEFVGQPAAETHRSAALLSRFELLELVRYAVGRAGHEPSTIGEFLARAVRDEGTDDAIWMGRAASEVADYDALHDVIRVAPSDYEQNLSEMVERVRERGGDAILLFNELWATPYRDAVAAVSHRLDVPWLDVQAIVATEKRRTERELERRLGLEPPAAALGEPTPDGLEIVFRVHAGRHPVPEALYVVAAPENLGGLVPNRTALHDDGTHGDQRAGDGVWSLAAWVEPGSRLFYVYTNSGREGLWEGLDVPDLRQRSLPAPAASRVYLPIDTFGELYMQADGWHTNASGYDRIAEALLAMLEAQPGVQEHIARRTGDDPARVAGRRASRAESR